MNYVPQFKGEMQPKGFANQIKVKSRWLLTKRGKNTELKNIALS